ncbi:MULTISPECIES: hypothetical protein [unclassified Streptomyces]|uniref:hypothetical protein n=1 Tax=unclassified Streptomyces TaxID=2593676 RepID=UPI00380922BD
MRKALAASAVAAAAALALAAPAAAFASDGSSATPTNSASPSASAKPTPTASTPSVTLSADNGRPGDKISVTIKDSGRKGTAHVVSKAFGGRVDLTPDAKTAGVWHGTATVADYPRDYFGVQAFVNGKLFDTVKFTVGEPKDDHGKDDSKGHGKKPSPKPSPDRSKEPVGRYPAPKGGVDTGMAPVAEDHTAANSALALGITAIGASALGGARLLDRRGRNQD